MPARDVGSFSARTSVCGGELPGWPYGGRWSSFYFSYYLASRMSLSWCPEEWACLETGAFASWACPLQEFYPSLCCKAEKRTPEWETGDPLSPKRTLWEAVRDVGIVLSNREWNTTLSLGTGGHLFLMGTLPDCVFPLQLVVFCVTAGWINDSCSWRL